MAHIANAADTQVSATLTTSENVPNGHQKIYQRFSRSGVASRKILYAAEMPDTAEHVRSMLLDPRDTAGNAWISPWIDVGGRVHVDHAPQLDALVSGACEPQSIKPYVWIGRSSTARDKCLSESKTPPDIEDFDVEVTAVDQATAKSIARELHLLEGLYTKFDGAFFDVHVSDQSDDYVERGGAVEFGLSTSALTIQVFRNG